MSDQRPYAPAPDAEAIRKRFRSPAVVLGRPVVRGVLATVEFAFRIRFRAEGLHRLEHLEPPLIFAANHTSHADTEAVLGTLPRRIRRRTAVAAALDVFGHSRGAPSLKRVYLEWVVAAGFHAFSFDRHGPPLRSLRASVQLIREGWSLLLFPEGTRSRTGQMSSFKAGAGILAKFTGRPVVPVYVEGGRQVLPCGGFLPRSGTVHVRYGMPQQFDKRESPEAFTARLQAEVKRLAGLGEPAESPPDTLPSSVKHVHR